MIHETVITTSGTWTNAGISVMDTRGRRVYELNGLRGNRWTISRNGLSAGTYLVRVTDGDAVHHSKLMVAGD
jgi:hypothetical protein